MFDKTELDDLRSRVPVSALVGKRVKLKRLGHDHFGICPFHKEKTPSFSVNDGKQLFKCFGCGASGDVFAWLQKVEGVSFREAVGRVRDLAGRTPHERPVRSTSPADEGSRSAEARRIWRAGRDLMPTDAAEVYLRGARRVGIDLPPTLRFHPALSAGSAGGLYPALLAAVTNDQRQVVAIQRTFLRPDGAGKADIPSPKRSLGPVRSGAVRLGAAHSTLGIAEGVETGLSAMEMYRLPVWCALGSNLAGLPVPDEVSTVIVFGDRGSAGEAAADKAVQAHRKRGRRIEVIYPPDGFGDFNDWLRALADGRCAA